LRLRRVGAADAGGRYGRRRGALSAWQRRLMEADAIVELFQEFGPVSVRRMLGGAGIFVDGRMIGLVSRDAIYLKADAETISSFEQEGLAPFSYATKNGEHKLTSYWRMPDRLYDDPQELARWARAAHAAAQRKAERSRKQSGKAKNENAKALRQPLRVRPRRLRDRPRT